MREQSSFLESLAGHFVPVHRDGHKFIAVAAILALILFFIWSPLGWLAVLATIFIAYFFRDPDRVTPLRDGFVVAAADGMIASIEKVRPPPELALGDRERVRIETHLSPFDVHINRVPVAGRVKRSVYIPGAFVNITSDKASEDNERRALVIEMPTGDEIAVVQIAGMVSRRIITFAHEGDSVGVGQRFGLIRFGSRVDVYLPPGKSTMVAVGQRSIAGETLLADLSSDAPAMEARRS
ncbi:Phosphatidylserine decarboxylase proenzyme [Candidatus Filomicrobium marinum]|uniref:Phosphatidylserine decarboxylase proenzyme n=2 Tax=Filomicrobium TaxID=119044 RepID=A0A0D6JKW4_9HYPH|nr:MULTISPECIES: phosphatidylserine decarboxylase [Filomicrobium]MCV0369008.1 phosphatidylserine decarboxylase [Filomicrobium sp.]CFX64150.1 Phosphatidylserine decarboxylase proenzyme [Candidatus Filomicrobium marinum]CPR22581.1 Phosphatidylserine decarboxylase proenzyme [Candidatus Filomicrobium marinum]SDO79375.1 phosphatidylserine decarboxylase [Filomicrobium insigne]